MTPEDLKRRTADFAPRIVRFCRDLPRTWEARKLGEQLLASGTAVAANYRSACRGRSRAEFIAKLGIVVEESDETEFWLALLKRAGISTGNELDSLLRESGELLAIFAAAQKTAKLNAARTKFISGAVIAIVLLAIL
jgi:four helix bundle protein